jgi:hypothetical protein
MRLFGTIVHEEGRSTMRAKLILLCFVAVVLGVANSTFALVTVSSTEIWDGRTMHGITPSGSGTAGDPYVYVISDGMTFTSSGVIDMNDKYVVFDFSSGTGDLEMAAGSYFDLTGSTRRSDPGRCTILLGDNNLTGSGDFKTVDITNDSMSVDISGSGSVSVNSLYLRVEDALAGSVTIDVCGSVSVDSIDTQDVDTNGDYGGDVIIRASDVTVGNIDTRAHRSSYDPDVTGGDVLLEASNCEGSDTLDNTLNAYGVIDTNSGVRSMVTLLSPA